MVQRTPQALASLYETDETAWLEQMAALVRAGQWHELDSVHLAEYLSDMAKRDRREVRSRLTVLLAHLLKWEHQPDQRSNSWRGTIEHQRQELLEILTSQVLRSHATDILPRAYANAIRQAAAETGLDVGVFPAVLSWTMEQILSEDLENLTQTMPSSE